MKSDMQLQRDVIDELRWDPQIKEKEIGVAAKDGVVTVSGSIASYAERWAVAVTPVPACTTAPSLPHSAAPAELTRLATIFE